VHQQSICHACFAAKPRLFYLFTNDEITTRVKRAALAKKSCKIFMPFRHGLGRLLGASAVVGI
jgi:hypothetical protein